MPSRRAAKQIHVSIVAGNPATLEGLRAYFDRVGVASHGTETVRDVEQMPPATTAVVLFPDDFAVEEVEPRLLALRRARPSVLVVLVTREPTSFKTAVSADGRSLPPIVLPRPAFGWTILDAIREHAEAGDR